MSLATLPFDGMLSCVFEKADSSLRACDMSLGGGGLVLFVWFDETVPHASHQKSSVTVDVIAFA
jgi:hypothetical protein